MAHTVQQFLNGAYRNMTRLSTAHFDLPKALSMVAGGERIILCERGKRVAALVPLSDLKAMEEDQADIEAYRRAKKEWMKEGGKTYSLAQVKRELGR
ncbi:MAG: hypothetical protein NTX50_21480 [Candidatus Sumerlaeota bacterium]|nr:hypothetical protein [Candidatus Sumerlaeota bacterium]